jgi:glycosyltransferase involved in cell wall biosynthesis
MNRTYCRGFSHKNMRLVIVIPSFYPAVVYGGPIITSYSICNELSKTIPNLCVVTTNANGRKKLEVIPNIFHTVNGYHVKYYNETIISRFSWSLLQGIKHDLKDADVVHIQGLFSSPVPVALFWAAKYKKKIVLTPHGEFGKWCLGYKRTVLKMLWLKFLIMPFLNKIVWHATAKAEEMEIQSVFPTAKIVVISNGVYLSDFRNFQILSKNQYVRKFSNEQNEPSHIILSVGRLHCVKGIDILIEAFKQVLQKVPLAMLFIAGEDEGQLSNLIQLSQKLGISEKVIFVGKITGKDKADLFANADVFALPSYSENFGIVYAEALAAGTPIVASTNTPWEDVEVAQCGRWVPNTPEAIFEAILDLLSRDRAVLRRNAVNFAKQFDWPKIAADFHVLYRDLITGKNPISPGV